MAKPVETLTRLLRKVFPPRAETSAVGMTIVLSALVGIGAGLMALLIDWAISSMNVRFFRLLGPMGGHAGGGRYLLLALVPAVVFLGVAAMLRRWAPEAMGTGIDQVMDAVGRQGGYIRARVLALKALATSLCIGVGAPLGMEGPVVQTGAAVGSLLGRRSRMGVPNIRILVAAGAAAGLAAKYGAPIGGAVFSAELILGSASTSALLPLIVASFLAVLTRITVRGPVPEYEIHGLFSFGWQDYVMFLMLGVVCGLVSVYFIRIIFATEDGMNRLLPQWWARAVFGGLIIGLAGALLPQTLGTGRGVVQTILREPEFGLRLLVLFVCLKPLLCSVALASGTSGGIFAPSLFTGAAAGALFAGAAGHVGWLDLAPETAYVMAGMAGVMAGVMRAPLQAILVTFELAQSYSMIPPLMITCVIALKVSELFEPESAFTLRLVRLGRRMRRGMDFSLLEGLSVSDVMDCEFLALPAAARISEIGQTVQVSENRTFPVADEQDRLAGIVMLASLISVVVRRRGRSDEPHVRDLLEPDNVYLSPDDSLASAWETMSNYDYDCLPVCEEGDDGPRIVGICEKEAIVELHDRETFIRLEQERPE